MRNEVTHVRQTSTFARYAPKTPSQQEALDACQKVAASIVKNADVFALKQSPLKAAKLIILHGPPGTGKTHLLEAIVNHVSEHAPKAIEGVYLSRYNFTHEHLSEGYSYKESPIVLLDDLFVQYQRLSDLHPVTDLRALSYWIKTLYERRVLCIVSSNFPFKDGLMPRVESTDPQGRMKSRVAELLRTGFEIEVVGPDGRKDVEAEGLDF